MDAGLSALLNAENDAKTIVENARKDRAAKLKDAQTQAQAEVEVFRSRFAAEFAQKEAEMNKQSEAHKEQLRLKTESEIKAIQETALKNQDAVIKMLLDIVSRVKIVARNEHHR